MDDSAAEILSAGVEAWNDWRRSNPGISPDLSGANLFGITTRGEGVLMKGHVTDLQGIDLSDAGLSRAFVESADLSGANLRGADLSKANFRRVTLEGADLTGADLYEVDLYYANLKRATLKETRMTRARLVDVNLEGARLIDCQVYGISAWNVSKDQTTEQSRLRVNDPANTWENPIFVDDLEVAQYIHLFLDPEKVRDVINATTAKLVLILGRFKPERKAVLDRLREELRNYDLVSVLFDFQFPDGRSMIETVGLLARMSRFVIADLSNPKLVIHELLDIVPANPSLPVRPIIQRGFPEPEALRVLRVRPSYLEPLVYTDADDLLSKLGESVVAVAEEKAKEMRSRKPGLGIELSS